MNTLAPGASRKFSPAAAALAEATVAGTSQSDLLDDLLAEAHSRVRDQMQPTQIEAPTNNNCAAQPRACCCHSTSSSSATYKARACPVPERRIEMVRHRLLQ